VKLDFDNLISTKFHDEYDCEIWQHVLHLSAFKRIMRGREEGKEEMKNYSTSTPVSQRQRHNDRVRQRLAELVMLRLCVETAEPLPKGYVGRVEGRLVFVTRPDGSLVDPFVDPGIAA
jgi:hypothetical protein